MALGNSESSTSSANLSGTGEVQTWFSILSALLRDDPEFLVSMAIPESNTCYCFNDFLHGEHFSIVYHGKVILSQFYVFPNASGGDFFICMRFL